MKAWALYFLVVAIPTALSIGIALWSGKADAERTRVAAEDERITQATKLRGFVESSTIRAQDHLQALKEDASVAEITAAVLTTDIPTALPYVRTNDGLFLPRDVESHRKELAFLASGTRNDAFLDIVLDGKGNANVFNGDGARIVVSRTFEGGVMVGFFTDALTVRRSAEAMLPPWLTLEPRPDTVRDPGTTPPVTFRRNAFAASKVGPTEVYVAPHAIFAVVYADPAGFEREVRWRRNMILFNWLVPLALFHAVSVVLFVRSRRAQRLADLRTDFVAAVSHELRTPLASVRMFAELLEAKAVPPEERGEVERALAEQTRRLHGTLERMLRFGALARGKLRADRAETRLLPIVEEAAATHAGQAQITIDVDPEAEAAIDAPLLKHAIENLIGNAVKYAPGPIVVRARVNGEVVIDVVDHGPGLDKSALSRVFLPFERVDARLSRATEGTGVGLSLVRAIARAHEGDASATSAIGRGSIFTVRFPARKGR